jgi:hypothetical protein
MRPRPRFHPGDKVSAPNDDRVTIKSSKLQDGEHIYRVEHPDGSRRVWSETELEENPA